MSRTTLDLDPASLAQLRRRAAAEGKSMGQVASELIAAAGDRPPRSPEFVWHSSDLGTPVVDLEDKDALQHALDATQ